MLACLIALHGSVYTSPNWAGANVVRILDALLMSVGKYAHRVLI